MDQKLHSPSCSKTERDRSRAYSGFQVRGHEVIGSGGGKSPVGSRGKASVRDLGTFPTEAEDFLYVKI